MAEQSISEDPDDDEPFTAEEAAFLRAYRQAPPDRKKAARDLVEHSVRLAKLLTKIVALAEEARDLYQIPSGTRLAHQAARKSALAAHTRPAERS
jgi:hypothetical protein